MGLLVFSLDRLAAPFQAINETMLEISKRRRVSLCARGVRLFFVLGGTGRVKMADGAEFDLSAGDAFLVPGGSRYAYLPAVPENSNRLHVLAFYFRPVGGTVPAGLGAMLAEKAAGPVYWSGVQTAEMLHGIHELREEAEKKRVGYAEAATARGVLLILALLRDQSQREPTPKSRPTGRHLVEQAREYIIKNYDDELSLADIAWRLRLSEEYLARLFRRVTGRTVFDFVRECRLNAAKRLLNGTNLPVVRVAAMAGFSSCSVFCRMFRQEVGCTPSAYRGEHAGNPNTS